VIESHLDIYSKIYEGNQRCERSTEELPEWKYFSECCEKDMKVRIIALLWGIIVVEGFVKHCYSIQLNTEI